MLVVLKILQKIKLKVPKKKLNCLKMLKMLIVLLEHLEFFFITWQTSFIPTKQILILVFSKNMQVLFNLFSFIILIPWITKLVPNPCPKSNFLQIVSIIVVTTTKIIQVYSKSKTLKLMCGRRIIFCNARLTVTRKQFTTLVWTQPFVEILFCFNSHR